MENEIEIKRPCIHADEEIKQNPRANSEGPHHTKLLTLHEPNCYSTEEGCDMMTLY
jgi:hypothetical protein